MAGGSVSSARVCELRRTSAVTGVGGAGPQAAPLGSPTEKRNARKERDGFGTGYGGPKVRPQ